MLHMPSYDMGRCAGITAHLLGANRPTCHDEVTGLSVILEMTEDRFFFPSSYVEGYLAAWDGNTRGFCSLEHLACERDNAVTVSMSDDE